MMKNRSGYPSPVEDEAIGNVTRENNRFVRQVFEQTEKMLSLLGFELEHIHIRDRKSRRIYSWPQKRK